MTEMIRFESRRVGVVEVPSSDVMDFEPMPGFAGRRRFVLMGHAPESELAWLVSLDDPDLAFVVASPWSFFPDYDPPVEREHLAALEIEKRDDVELFCLVTLTDKQIHLNLAAPLMVNAATRRGLQVLSDQTRYASRTPIPAVMPTAPAENARERSEVSAAGPAR
jgi:flagellar assembly factor FliW